MSSDSDDWNDWASDEDDDCEFASPIIDLYNNTIIHPTPSTFLKETIAKYNFDLNQFMDSNKLNTYNRIRCVNYLRTITQGQNYNQDEPLLSSVLQADIQKWQNNDDFLIPQIEADGLVQYAATANHHFDSDDDEFWNEDEDDEQDGGDEDDEEGNDTIKDGDDDADVTRQPSALYEEQLQLNKHQSVQIRKMQQQIEQLTTMLDNARTTFKEYVFDDNGLLSTTTPNVATIISPSNPNNSQLDNNNNNNNAVKSKFGKDDHYYFASYSQRNIHEEMLSDQHRTESYEDAFKQLAPILKDKIVLDVGCGTGILSMFAARNGAKHVIGVDAADIIDKTRDIVKANGFGDKITLVKGKVEEVVLPFDTVDIIVSEWMGYYLLYESMLPSVFYARNKWLRREDSGVSIFEENKKAHNSTYQYNDQTDAQLTRKFASHTRLLPDVSRMYVAGSNTRDLRSKRIDFWKNVYGFDMSVMINDIETYPNNEVEIIPGNDIVTTDNMYGVFDLMVDTAKELDFYTENIKIVAVEDELVDSFTVWFDTPFTNPLGNVNQRGPTELRDIARTTPLATQIAMTKNNDNNNNTNKVVSPQDIILTTAPNMVPTHWRQTIFRLKYIMPVKKGDEIVLSINSHIRKDNHRHYDVDIKYSYQTSVENLNINDKTSIPHTNYAKPGDVYEQSYSLQ